jgi:hypothetical protein
MVRSCRLLISSPSVCLQAGASLFCISAPKGKRANLILFVAAKETGPSAGGHTEAAALEAVVPAAGSGHDPING